MRHLDIARECGITYRSLNYWATNGWLRPVGGNGTGHQREWPASELAVARDMGELTRAGMTPELAHAIARASMTRSFLALIAEARRPALRVQDLSDDEEMTG